MLFLSNISGSNDRDTENLDAKDIDAEIILVKENLILLVLFVFILKYLIFL
jgi:hypothetical protein